MTGEPEPRRGLLELVRLAVVGLLRLVVGLELVRLVELLFFVFVRLESRHVLVAPDASAVVFATAFLAGPGLVCAHSSPVSDSGSNAVSNLSP